MNTQTIRNTENGTEITIIAGQGIAVRNHTLVAGMEWSEAVELAKMVLAYEADEAIARQLEDAADAKADALSAGWGWD